MGNRAVIETPKRDLGVYLHWNGGRDSVEGFLRYCDMQGFRAPENDDYGWARLCQVLGNFFGGSLCVGIGLAESMDEDNGDNGVYIVEDWKIKERLYQRHSEQYAYPMYEMLKDINDKFPEKERLEDAVLRRSAIDFYAEMSDEEFVKRRNYFINCFSRDADAIKEYDETPGIKERLATMESKDRD